MHLSTTFDHSVLFYETDGDLTNHITQYFIGGFRAEESCIIIATLEHRNILEKQLKSAGFNVRLMESLGKYIPLDAEQTLSYFMENNLPNKELFNEVVGSLVPYLPKNKIRGYGEMVAILAEQGNKDGAIELEKLWEEFGSRRPLSLLCAYPKIVLKDDRFNFTDAVNSLHRSTVSV